MQKRILLFLLILSQKMVAQNVGIGTTTPGATLDVMRGTASGGAAQFRGSTHVSHFNYSTTENTFIRAGKDNGDVILNDIPGGKVGIGTPTPGFPLSFPNTVGDKISLWGSSGAHYGFGIQGSLLQIHAAASNDDIAFGYGSSAAFTETMRIKGDGSIGIGTSTPDASAQLDISSTTKGFLPPRMTMAQRDAITVAEGLIIFNTTSKKPNYYDGTEWKNFDGTSAFSFAIGDSHQGGIIFYILQNGDPGYIPGQTHGLIAAASDQSVSQWGCAGTAIPGADGTALGTGDQNTIDIMTGCPTAGIAARICGDLILNGYSDWYLPSLDELNKLYINRAAVGGFGSGGYFSSSEINLNDARYVSFQSGLPNPANKGTLLTVRAIRSF